jgi:hypothetical protein
VIEVEFKVRTEKHTVRHFVDNPSQVHSDSGHGHLFGDGMAIWLTKERIQPGPVFGNKGPHPSSLMPGSQLDLVQFSDNFEGLGIFLDT